MTVIDQLAPAVPANRPLPWASVASLVPFVGHDLDIRIAGQAGTITLPAEAVRLLVDSLAELAVGRPVAAVVRPAAMTVAEAADYLDVSPGWLVEKLDAGELPAVGDGPDRRIRPVDVLRYRQVMYERRLRTLAELSALDQELGLA